MFHTRKSAMALASDLSEMLSPASTTQLLPAYVSLAVWRISCLALPPHQVDQAADHRRSLTT